MGCVVCGCPEAKWLRVGTVAAQFKCTPKRVRRLIKKGEIEAVRFGGHWRIDHQSLDDYVRKDSIRFSVPDPDAPW
ncbi:MAG: helix-turn-helix domain-containing protein [Planctomycetota bacterium]|jgi:excisionase family DNA binding protein